MHKDTTIGMNTVDIIDTTILNRVIEKIIDWFLMKKLTLTECIVYKLTILLAIIMTLIIILL